MGVPYIKVRLFSAFSLPSSLFSFFLLLKAFYLGNRGKGDRKDSIKQNQDVNGKFFHFWPPGLQNLVLYGRNVCMVCLLLNKKVCKAFQNCKLFCYLLVTFPPGYIYITCFVHTLYFVYIKISIWMST